MKRNGRQNKNTSHCSLLSSTGKLPFPIQKMEDALARPFDVWYHTRIQEEVDHDLRAIYFTESDNGLPMRMGLLKWILKK